MLTSLLIKNFKAWQDTGDLKLAPLTVIFGPNSSGKSSLGHFLLALKRAEGKRSGSGATHRDVDTDHQPDPRGGEPQPSPQ